jgi:hypothetical protein
MEITSIILKKTELQEIIAHFEKRAVITELRKEKTETLNPGLIYKLQI